MKLERRQEYEIRNKRYEKVEFEECGNTRKSNPKDEIGEPRKRRVCTEVRETEREKYEKLRGQNWQ